MSAGDLGAGIVLLRRGSRSTWISLVIPAGVGLYGFYRLVTGGTIVGLLLLALAASTFAFMYSGRLNGLMVRRQFRPLMAHPITLTVSDGGLDFTSGPGSGHLDWSAVHDVKEDRRVLVITRDATMSWAIIPKAAFAGEDEVNEFREAVLRRRDGARSDAPGSAPGTGRT